MSDLPRTHMEYGAHRPNDPITVRQRLDELASVLADLSERLNTVQEEFIGVEQAYQDERDRREVDLYLDFMRRSAKLPSADLRRQLVERQMEPELVGTRNGLLMKRDQLRERIRNLRGEIDAERSILSALKEEMSATTYRGPR